MALTFEELKKNYQDDKAQCGPLSKDNFDVVVVMSRYIKSLENLLQPKSCKTCKHKHIHYDECQLLHYKEYFNDYEYVEGNLYVDDDFYCNNYKEKDKE